MIHLTNLLKKDHPWLWSEEAKASFDKLKTTIATELVLKLPNFEAPFEVYTDASNRAVGGVLVQEGYSVALES